MAHYIGQVSIDKSCYSMYDVAASEHISKARMSSMASITLKNSKIICGNSAKEIAEMFNSVGCLDGSVNAFLTHDALRPFAKAFRLRFEKSYSLSGKQAEFGMFYIAKKDYDAWKKKKIEYVPHRSGIKEYSKPIEEKKSKVVKFPYNAIIKHFEACAKKYEYSFAELATAAIDEYIKNHNDLFGSVTADVSEVNTLGNSSSLIWAYIDKDITSGIFKAIQRYNYCNSPPVNFSDFVETALSEKLEKMPVKYTNPQKLSAVEKLINENSDLLKD